MDYVSMKMSIYENYANGKLTQENARQLIDVLNNNYGSTLVQEMVDAENEFMMNSVNVAYESAGMDALYEASETFGQKVAKIWENFKKWIKGIIDAILGRKKEVPDKSKVTVKKGLPKAMDDLLTQVKKLKSAKSAVAIGTAVAGVIGATAVVKKLKGKPAEGDATEETNATELNNTAKEIATAAAAAPEVGQTETPAPAQAETPAAPQGASSEQKKTTDPKPEAEPEKSSVAKRKLKAASGGQTTHTYRNRFYRLNPKAENPTDRIAEGLKAPVKDSDVIRSATGAATVADDVSKQIIALLPAHAESLTPSREAHTQGTKGLFGKFYHDCGLYDLAENTDDLLTSARFVLYQYAQFDPDREKSGKSVKEILNKYLDDNGGKDFKNNDYQDDYINGYVEEYRSILDKEYPDTPEGYEKFRSALVSRNGKIVSMVKNLETIYNRVNNPSRKRNLLRANYLKKEDWSAQAVSVMTKFYINCRKFDWRVQGLIRALSKKCRNNPSLKD
jgi:hypothetical protein